MNIPQIHIRKNQLFILSHMRSRSSLLSHILGSHPNICGYSELHISYQNYQSFKKMRRRLHSELGSSFREKFLLDKILYNERLSSSAYKTAKPKLLFLLREPESSIKSIINMGHQINVEWYKDPVQATAYYCDRLLGIEHESSKFGQGNLFIESDTLVENTKYTLERITAWLNLRTPLTQNYAVFKNTGKEGHGDPLRHIKTGALTRTKEHHHIKIPADTLKKGVDAYEKCKEALMINATG